MSKHNSFRIIIPILILGLLLAASYLRRSSPFPPNRDPSEFQVPPTKPTPDEKKCYPANSGKYTKCEEGIIIVYGSRFMKLEEMEKILNTYSLELISQTESPESPYIYVTKLPTTKSSPEWNIYFRDPYIASTNINDVVYVDRNYSDGYITFHPGTTDDQIEEYLYRKSIIDYVEVNWKLVNTNRYTVGVPIGTEFEWDAVLMGDDNRIMGVTRRTFLHPIRLN